MNQTPQQTLFFKQSHFVTHLPVDYRYTKSHFWAENRGDNRLRLGFTRFATRMLGELVDHKFDTPPGTSVHLGQVLGWVEGFKAVSDVICAGQGRFAGANLALNDNIGLINESTYDEGWLYELEGQLDNQSLDVHGYAQHLKATIDRLLEKQQAEELDANSPPNESRS